MPIFFLFSTIGVGCVLILLPAMLNLKIHQDNYVNGMPDEFISYPVISAFSSSDIKSALLVCVASSVPIMLHLFVFVLWGRKLSDAPGNALQIIWVLLVSLFLPQTIALCLSTNSSRYFVAIMGLFNCRQLLVYCSAFTLLHIYGPHIWRKVYIVPMVVLYTTFTVIVTYVPFVSLRHQRSMKLSVYILISIAVFIYFITSVRWYRHIFSLSPSKKLSSGQRCCTGYLFALTVLAFGQLIIFFVMRKSRANWLFNDISSIITGISVLTVYTVIVAVVNWQNILEEIIATKAHREASIRRKIVSFFSHELRTPLNSAMMGLVIVKRDILLNKSTSNLSTICEVEASCANVVDVLHDMLTFDEIDSGNFLLKLKPTLIKGLITQRLDICREQCCERDIRLSVSISDRCHMNIHLLADASIVSQILRHVLFNAMDSAGDGGHIDAVVDLTPVYSQSSSSSSQTLSAYVLFVQLSDSGPVISQKAFQQTNVDNIFDFTPGVIEAGKAGALGLLITRHLLCSMDGSFSLEPLTNTVGNKVTVTLTLPLTMPMPTDPSSEVQFEHGSRYSPRSSHTKDETSHRTPSRRFLPIPIPGPQRALDLDLERGSGMHLSVTVSEGPGQDTTERGVLTYPPVPVPAALPAEEPATVDHASTGERNSNSFDAGGANGERRGREEGDGVGTDRSKLHRVLVVDDVAMNRKMLCRLLEGHCEASVTAENGLVAVERMHASMSEGPCFDLVLMDYQMPVMDGPSAARAMRDMHYTGPIIGVTGNVLSSDVDTFVSHGADAVLPKPLDFNLLQSTVLNRRFRTY